MALSSVLAIAPTSMVAARTCEDLFRKEKFFNPSVEVSKQGHLELRVTNSNSTMGRFMNSLVRLLRRPLLLNRIDKVGERLINDKREDVPFWVKLSDAFGLEIRIEAKSLEGIPRTGPLIIVSNHPMNGVEGIALAALISKVRPDVKVVLTPLLEFVPEMAQNAIFANPYGGVAARQENVRARGQMVDELKSGHAFVIFPSGTVSGKTSWRAKDVEDGQWKKGVAEMLDQVPDARVLPIFVEGEPSKAFLNATLLADKVLQSFKALRVGVGAIFHIREIGNRTEQSVGLVVGQPIEGAEVLSWGNSARMMENLKRVTYGLRASRSELVPLDGVQYLKKSGRVLLPIAPKMDMAVVHAELRNKARIIYDRSPEDSKKGMRVFLARGRDIPRVMNEIGRLREITFREVGEGSGKERDLDAYDLDYYQLIAIDKKTGAIAGGYRIGKVDDLLQKRGYEGLYTSLFFDHSRLFRGPMENTLELGRSFVVPEFQRSIALAVLFSGIGRFIRENPKYRYLMGPVSITNELSERSKGLILAYLREFYSANDANLVTPLTPLREEIRVSPEDIPFLASTPSVTELTRKVHEIEEQAGTGAKMPTLVPIYSGLGARFFKFNFDAEFNSIDGLIVVDFPAVDTKSLQSYLGADGVKSYLDFHGVKRDGLN